MATSKNNLKEEFRKEVSDGKHRFINIALDSELPKRIREAVSKLRKFKKVIILGIGGSALGGIAVMRALYRPLKHMEDDSTHFFFLDQIDPDLIYHLSHNLDLKETHFISISKSGDTIEPASLYKLFYQKIVDAGLDPKEHFSFVTGEDGFFAEEAKKIGAIHLILPPYLSGRFSVLSEVGLFPAVLAGINIEEILEGARQAYEEFYTALDLAITQDKLYQEGKIITVVFPYSYRLNRFADWYIQLMAESLGKTKDIGPTPIRAIGPTDQHAQLQLFMEGPRNKQVLFLEVEKHHHDPQIPGENYTLEDLINAEKKGTGQALEDAGIPTQTIKLPYIDAKAVGNLIMTLELQIALLGKMYGIETYKQPGVEAGKKITREILQNS